METKKKYSVITMWDVLEHTTDPNAYVKHAYKSLTTGGLLYITTPNYYCFNHFYRRKELLNVVVPEHLFYFTKESLKLLLKNNDFRIVRINGSSRTKNLQPISFFPIHDKKGKGHVDVLNKKTFPLMRTAYKIFCYEMTYFLAFFGITEYITIIVVKD